MYDSVPQCVAVCCSVLQCVAVCCSALQCFVLFETDMIGNDMQEFSMHTIFEKKRVCLSSEAVVAIVSYIYTHTRAQAHTHVHISTLAPYAKKKTPAYHYV